jgi:serine/threonine protein kinase
LKRDAAEIAALSRLIDTALELPPEQRAAWIEQLPAANDTLKPALRKMLSPGPATADSHTLSDVSRRVRIALQGVVTGGEALEFKDGALVGPYELIRELGRGGMGTVWLARRTEGLTRRTVALKLPHPGMLHAEFAARMERERDILESLAHSNIARLYDAGMTPAGQPYLALEYIEGTPINVYCDHKRLGIRERVRLFAQVLQAIQHAHSHLVIHRDLKPANILVTESGNAVVLDFGIAKLITEGATAETALTQFGGRALTPDYASPEQIAGASLTTASDVYSLGVILYELLSGERPYKLTRGSVGALEEAILAANVRRPSLATTDKAKARILRGDLDTIVLTALRAKLSDRYRSVDALAVDIDHFLAGRAIAARPESWWEASRRFVSRHKLAVGSATLIVLALGTGIVTTTWQAKKARESEQRAIAAAGTSDAVKQFLIRIFQANTLYQDNAAQAREKTALQLLEDGADRIGIEFKDRPELHRELLAIILQMLSESRSPKFQQHAQEYIDLLENVPGGELKAAAVYNDLAIMQQRVDDKVSEQIVQKGLATLGPAGDPDHRRWRGMMLYTLAVSIGNQGDRDRQLPPLLESRALLEDGFTNTVDYGKVLTELGWREARADHVDAAVDYFERAMPAIKADPTVYPRTIAWSMNNLASGYLLRKRWDDAAREFNAAANIFRVQLGEEDPETAFANLRRAKAIALLNRYDEAIPELRAQSAILDKPSPNSAPDYLAVGHEYVADALLQSGRLQEAGIEIKRSLELSSKLTLYSQITPQFIAAEHDAMVGDVKSAEAYGRRAVEMTAQFFGTGTARIHKSNNRLGRILLSVGNYRDADAVFAAILQADAEHAAVYDSPWTLASIGHARAQLQLGQALPAAATLAGTLQRFLAQPANVRDLNEELELQLALGRALTASDRAREALPHLDRALELLRPQYSFSPRLAEGMVALADCRLALKDFAAARELASRAKAIFAANGPLGAQFHRPLAQLTARLPMASTN